MLGAWDPLDFGDGCTVDGALWLLACDRMLIYGAKPKVSYIFIEPCVPL